MTRCPRFFTCLDQVELAELEEGRRQKKRPDWVEPQLLEKEVKR